MSPLLFSQPIWLELLFTKSWTIIGFCFCTSVDYFVFVTLIYQNNDQARTEGSKQHLVTLGGVPNLDLCRQEREWPCSQNRNVCCLLNWDLVKWEWHNCTRYGIPMEQPWIKWIQKKRFLIFFLLFPSPTKFLNLLTLLGSSKSRMNWD